MPTLADLQLTRHLQQLLRPGMIDGSLSVVDLASRHVVRFFRLSRERDRPEIVLSVPTLQLQQHQHDRLLALLRQYGQPEEGGAGVDMNITQNASLGTHLTHCIVNDVFEKGDEEGLAIEEDGLQVPW